MTQRGDGSRHSWHASNSFAGPLPVVVPGGLQRGIATTTAPPIEKRASSRSTERRLSGGIRPGRCILSMRLQGAEEGLRACGDARKPRHRSSIFSLGCRGSQSTSHVKLEIGTSGVTAEVVRAWYIVGAMSVQTPTYYCETAADEGEIAALFASGRSAVASHAAPARFTTLVGWCESATPRKPSSDLAIDLTL
ncbi:hypothetical protein P171DRAFT_440334 [Karstenula rhodostoma CBS 690.94]|uniref:Uncharacterized protein n=1 Tax=Karstenula rhodostoma CBS 690.94 TaxID=1392251 RepID=A0A9P4PT30_9PLEO|nr:hypothetical protein P171DRAFT_440334 [Karstenula rhodostoma CBS 690.94]